MINIMLVQGEKLFREALQILFQSRDDMTVVATASNGKDAVKRATEAQPDVILLDVHIPKMDGIRVTKLIKIQFPDIKIILMHPKIDEETIIEGLINGADGFLLENLDFESVTQSIRHAYTGQIVLAGEVARVLAKRIAELNWTKKDVLMRKLEMRDIRLSPRELDVGYCLLENKRNSEIAKQLYLSEGTVKNYVSQLYDKTGVNTRKELVNFLRYVLN
ncbi:response regulator [Lentibacillus saliphilus]|uniref:response regulator n=1 Tax=Lentibacillus saliphilus TaxID=2737028 RepID=UPI001C309002|nr:response regulator transcription factor [Lentibacillus saliphilus]